MRNSLSFAVVCRVIANLSAVATAFVSIRLYNLYVSKDVYGTILVGLQVISYLPLMSGGFRIVLNQRMLAEPDAAETHSIARFGQTLQSYFFVVVVLGGVVGMAAYSLLPKTHALGIPFLVYVTIGIAGALTFQAGSQLALLVAFGEQVQGSLIQAAWSVLTLLILWLSFASGLGVWAFPISNGFGALVVVLVSKVALAWTKNNVPLFVWRPRSDFRARLKVIWAPALDCLVNQVAMILVFTLDIILVGVLVGPGPAAVYGIVSRVTTISRQVLTSLAEAAWPRLTQESDVGRKAQIMRKVDRLNAWLVGCWYGAMAVTLHSFLGWLVKSDWVATPLLISLVVARNFVISVVSPHAYGLQSAGRFRELARILQAEALIGLVAGSAFSLLWGSNGTAIAFLFGTCAVSSWRLTREYFRYAHESHWILEWLAIFWRGMTGGIFSTALAVGLLLSSRSMSIPQGLLAIVAGGVGFSLPVGIVLARWRVTGKIP